MGGQVAYFCAICFFNFLNLSLLILYLDGGYRFSLSAFYPHGFLLFLGFFLLRLYLFLLAHGLPRLLLLEFLFFDLGQSDSSLVFLVILLETVNFFDE